MARAKDKQQWNHTSTILATLFNTRAFRKGPAVKPQQLHPYLRGKHTGRTGMPLTKHTLIFLAMAMGAEGVPEQ